MVAAPPTTGAETVPLRLPPQQAILRKGETIFDLHKVAEELTVVVSTSVGEFTPSTDPVIACLESLQANVALRWCRKLLVFDKVPSLEEIEAMRRDRDNFHVVTKVPKWRDMWNAKRESYDEYCEALRRMKAANHPALFNVDLVFLPSFGHLFGTVKVAFEHIRTRFAFVTQHDLRLGGHFVAADVQMILEALHTSQVNYIVLNRDVNSAARAKVYYKYLPDFNIPTAATAGQTRERGSIALTAMAGFSDQAHFVEAAWYCREVVDAIRPEQRLTCMEHVLHDVWKDRSAFRGTFLYGGTDDGPYVLDLVHGLQVYDAFGRLRGLPPPPSRPVA